MENYQKPILGILAINFTYFFITYKFAMGTRFKIYNGNFMKKFVEEHKKAYPQDSRPPSLGYPDCGQGWYSRKLSYKDWFIMNCAQRCQHNFLEQLPIVIISSLISGIKYPDYTLYLDLAYCFARIAYSYGYMKHGPKGRAVGAVSQSLVLLALILMAY